jgi:hypothetical protein
MSGSWKRGSEFRETVKVVDTLGIDTSKVLEVVV